MLPCAPPAPWPPPAPPPPRRPAPPAPPPRAAKPLSPPCAPSGRSHPGRDRRSVRRPGRASAKPGSLPPAPPPGGSPRSSTAPPEPAAERAPRESAACSRPTDTRPAPPARLPASSAGSEATVGSAIPARFRPASSTALAARRRPRLLPAASRGGWCCGEEPYRPAARWERCAPSASSTSSSRTCAMSSRIRSRSLCSRLSRQGFPCSWCGLGAVLLFVMAYPPVAETSSKEIPVLFSTTSQEHTPFTFLQESGQNPASFRLHVFVESLHVVLGVGPVLHVP